jgi:hypothetical protein
MKVDGQRRPITVLGDFRVHDEILNVNRAKGVDGVGDPAQECGHVSLVLASGIGLAEVFDGP